MRERALEAVLPAHESAHVCASRIPLLARARSLLAPLLIAGAAALPADSVPAAAPPLGSEREEAKDFPLAAMRARIPSLIFALDDDKFAIRDRAQRELEAMIIQWVRSRQAPFPFKELLRPFAEYSLEQQRRCERIGELCEREELAILWLGTVFQKPSHWKERPSPPTVGDVADALAAQTGERLSLWQEQVKGTLIPPTLSLEGKTFWEILSELRCRKGERLSYTRSFDGTLVGTETLLPHARAVEGSVYGMLWVHEKTVVHQRPIVALSLLSEEKVLLGDCTVESATYRTVEGKTGELVLKWQHLHHCSPYFELEVPGEGMPVEVAVTVRLVGHLPVHVPVALPAGKGVVARTRACRFSVRNIESTTERRTDKKPVWQVMGEFHDVDLLRGENLFYMSRCMGMTKDGRRVVGVGSGLDGPRKLYAWEFAEEPSSLVITLPDAETTTTKTLHFRNVPRGRGW